MDIYDLPALNAALHGTAFAGQLQHFPVIDSTNTYAVQQAQAGAPHGSVYLADEQTAGRGRGGHTWHSRIGDGLYVSILLRPQLSAERGLWLSLATGIAVQGAIKQVTGLAADIRWPNDILLPEKKCAGILVEASLQAARPYAVIGIGINVNHESFPPELAELATSLRIASGEQQDRGRMLVSLLQALETETAALQQGAALLERFAAASTWARGKRVNVPEDGGYTGITAGLDERGFLRVQDDNGRIRTVLSGGVRPV